MESVTRFPDLGFSNKTLKNNDKNDTELNDKNDIELNDKNDIIQMFADNGFIINPDMNDNDLLEGIKYIIDKTKSKEKKDEIYVTKMDINEFSKLMRMKFNNTDTKKNLENILFCLMMLIKHKSLNEKKNSSKTVGGERSSTSKMWNFFIKICVVVVVFCIVNYLLSFMSNYTGGGYMCRSLICSRTWWGWSASIANDEIATRIDRAEALYNLVILPILTIFLYQIYRAELDTENGRQGFLENLDNTVDNVVRRGVYEYPAAMAALARQRQQTRRNIIAAGLNITNRGLAYYGVPITFPADALIRVFDTNGNLLTQHGEENSRRILSYVANTNSNGQLVLREEPAAAQGQVRQAQAELIQAQAQGQVMQVFRRENVRPIVDHAFILQNANADPQNANADVPIAEVVIINQPDNERNNNDDNARRNRGGKNIKTRNAKKNNRKTRKNKL